jgi:imidazole glycerol-phosphate synthase subunit HisH
VIALIDYHAGNLTSVKKALAAVGADVVVPREPADVARADAVIVPGVGHFGATRALDRAWIDAIGGQVRRGRPLLGICLGMQWLFESSEEAPDVKGLGVLEGMCVRLKPDTTTRDACGVRLQADLKVPHVGWNSLALQRDAWIVDGVRDGAQVYFTHSYVAPTTDDCVAVTEHGLPFAAIVQRDHVAGVQFHPEKSGEVGLRILRNFVNVVS